MTALCLRLSCSSPAFCGSPNAFVLRLAARLGGNDVREGSKVAFIADWTVGESANQELCLMDLGGDRGAGTFLPLLRDGRRLRICTTVA